ncbi:MAG: SdpI family protein [Daejeonella sp.]
MYKILVLPILLILLFITYFLFPPKSINRIYGYRTSYTMQNREIWNYANKVASKYLLIFSLILLIFDFLLLLWSSKYSEGISFLLLLIGFITTIILIEKKIRTNSYD